jgi:hypothetical protein
LRPSKIGRLFCDTIAALSRLSVVRIGSSSSTPRARRLGGVFGFRSAACSATALRERWQARSIRSGWPGTAAEWHCAAVDAVCAGLVESGAARPDIRVAGRCLGEQRSAVGAQLFEARKDLEVGLALAHASAVRRLVLLDALTVGWAEYGVEQLAADELVNECSDLPRLPYLLHRLRELYREAAVIGVDVASSHLLVVVETDHSPDKLVREARLAALHSALEFGFVGGESVVAVSARRAIALSTRDEPRLSDSLARLRSELEIAVAEMRLPAVRCWRKPLPSTVGQLGALIADLRF